MGRALFAGLAIVASIATSGCSSESTPDSVPSTAETAATSAAPPADTPRSAAERIKAAVPEVPEVVEITEDNDPNDLIGRPNGYSAAAVTIDSRVECSPAGSLGADCGATIEQWPDETAAQKRADYIQEMLGNLQFAGTEWSTVKGNLLLRVSGALKPSEADQYKAAFSG